MEKLSKAVGIKVIIVLGIVSYALQYTWESLQCEPFFKHPPTNWMAADMFTAAIGDVVMTFIEYAVIAWVFKSWNWFLHRWSRKQWMLMLGIGLFSSVLIELLSEARNSWGYTDLAPLIPGLDISIIPVLQFLILFPLSFALTRYIVR
jgi:hypothetical protein